MLNRVSSGLAVAAKAVADVVPVILRDGVGLIGVGLISYGAWAIFPPAGYITGGTLLLAGTLIVSRG